MNNQKLIVRIIIFLLACAFIYYIRDTLFPVVMSFILFYILNPVVSLLSNKRGKWPGLNIHISIVASFLFAAFIIFLFFQFIIPPLALEFKRFGQNIPFYLDSTKGIIANIQQWYMGHNVPLALHHIIVQGFENLMSTALNMTQSFAQNMVKITGQFVKIIIIPIFAYYLLKDKDKLKEGMLNLLPKESRKISANLLEKINKTLNSYIKGIFILCLVVGLLATIGLKILGVKYALALGLIAGITEAIPIIGPWLGALPAIMIALIIDPALALKVALLYLIIQALENSLLVPKILGNNLNLHPVVIILSILVLGKILGAWGLFFAAPLAAIINIVYQELRA
ncbi:MAG: AI-2E family transporter [Candidatus Saganbacteria bacterium]|nr:AI-2E family transporter [Candidatus Saganbacteria bacterium]